MKKILGAALVLAVLVAAVPSTASAIGGVKTCIKAPCGVPMPNTRIGGAGTGTSNRGGSGSGTSSGAGQRNLPPSPAGK